jgi:hypothetical protein
MRKPEAAHLMNWFYELPPFIDGSSRLEDLDPVQIIRSAITICACWRIEVKTQFLGRVEQE